MSTGATKPGRQSGRTARKAEATLGGRGRPATWRRAPWVPAARALAYTVAVLCVAVLVGAGTMRGTLLERDFYQGVLDDERAYERLYDEVLVDPQARPVTRSLLARLPVPESVVTANLKIVLPPATVRELTGEQIGRMLGYLRGDSDTLAVSVDLAPVLANVDRLAQIYLGELVSGPEKRSDADRAATLARVDAALDRIAAGDRPANLPRVELGDRAVQKVTSFLLSGVPEDERASLRPQVEGALGMGDVATALAAVGPHLTGSRVEDRSAEGKRELLRITEGGRWNVVEDLRGAGVDIGALDSARDAVRLAEGSAQTLAVLLGVLATVFLWLSGPPGRTRRLRTVGWILAASGCLAAALFAASRWWAEALLWRPPRSWPPSLAALVEDLQATALSEMAEAGLSASATPLAVGVVLVAGCSIWAHRANPRPLPVRHRAGVLGGSAVLTTTAVVLGVALAPAAARDSGGTYYCNGSAALCGLRYDQGAYLATHNAMSSTADRFLSPLQDGDITTQLDNGARALLIDTHTWERPEEITRRLRLSEYSPRMQRRITDVIGRTGPTRPGLWLCHAVCRAGAVPLVDTLRSIGSWLEAHPREVVTLIVQNGITGEQTASAFERAGLQRLLYTPDDDPQAPWPTVREMIETDERLVVFAEGSGGPAPWYREFYRYGMETPYAFSSPGEMSCRPNRGGTGKRLFLLNHFVTDGGGSRIAAARVNDEEFVVDRARRCSAERGRPVNFVAVDFANLGSAEKAVDALNAARAR